MTHLKILGSKILFMFLPCRKVKGNFHRKGKFCYLENETDIQSRTAKKQNNTVKLSIVSSLSLW